MGYLIFKSGFWPKFLGVLLIIGCVGYLINFFTHFLLPNSGITFSEVTFIEELRLPLWLVVKGVDVENWENLDNRTGVSNTTVRTLGRFLSWVAGPIHLKKIPENRVWHT
jgi:hypothetical protein